MWNSNNPSRRLRVLKTIALFVAAVLFVKVLLSILLQYQWYFPPNFDAAFLIGRRETFTGIYAAAFYTHIISAPLALILGAFLMLSGGRRAIRRVHRWTGRTQMLIVFALVAPSSLVMAGQAFAGPIAGCGFAVLAIATVLSAAVTIRNALSGNFSAHQTWARRCFILLASPLLFRLFSGSLVVLERESEWAYRVNAWLSWILPMAIHEAWQLYTANGGVRLPRRKPSRRTKEAVL